MVEPTVDIVAAPPSVPPPVDVLPAPPAEHEPFVPDKENLPEFTWPAVVVGALLGIVFGASSLYLVLKVGLTVSASIPVAVLSITLFRLFSRLTGFRKATILENNIVQTTGSAGESIAFGVGVTMPALLLLGFEMDVIRVMTVGVLGGLLGILMMIPLRRAFIVKQHGQLVYPEGTACAEVLITGEKGGATALMVFLGFGVAFFHKFLMSAMQMWNDTPALKLYDEQGRGLKGGELSGELSPELLGVGYIIGPRIASVMAAGGVLSALVLIPMISYFGDDVNAPVPPAQKTAESSGLIRDMDVEAIHKTYIIFIGAGAVATGGIVSMLQALPLIIGSFRAGLRDILAGSKDASAPTTRRTERDLSTSIVIFGSLGLVVAIAIAPSLGLGLSVRGLVGALLIVVLGFLFVTVSSRLTGEIGSSSNPISGMTVATLLLTCLVFLLMGHTDKAATLTAMTVAAVVCVASSNGGTTSQDLKTGYLVGGTPRYMQLGIIIGALTSAVVIGFTLLLLNAAGTVYSKKDLPQRPIPDAVERSGGYEQRAGGQYADDPTLYYAVTLAPGEIAMEGSLPEIPAGKYLTDAEGRIHYYVDPAINGRLKTRDDGEVVPFKPRAPKTVLMASIDIGILNQRLPWVLVIIGVLIAVTLELSGVPSLPFAVGVYLPLSSSSPIFVGGMIRWIVDRLSRKRSDAESETSPGVLLASGFIAGGTIAGVLVAFFNLAPSNIILKTLDMSGNLPETWTKSVWSSIIPFTVLIVLLILAGTEILFRAKPVVAPTMPPSTDRPPTQE
jgi:putative OPT family oligopeptide transporter